MSAPRFWHLEKVSGWQWRSPVDDAARRRSEAVPRPRRPLAFAWCVLALADTLPVVRVLLAPWGPS